MVHPATDSWRFGALRCLYPDFLLVRASALRLQLENQRRERARDNAKSNKPPAIARQGVWSLLLPSSSTPLTSSLCKANQGQSLRCASLLEVSHVSKMHISSVAASKHSVSFCSLMVSLHHAPHLDRWFCRPTASCGGAPYRAQGKTMG